MCSMFVVVLGAGVFGGVSPEYLAVCNRFPDVWNGQTGSALRGELDAVVSENGTDLVGGQPRSVGAGNLTRRRWCSPTKANFDVGSMATSI